MGILDLKFSLLMAICRESEVSRDDLLLGWQLLHDLEIMRRLEEEGLGEEAKFCRTMGQSHWYLSSLRKRLDAVAEASNGEEG